MVCEVECEPIREVKQRQVGSQCRQSWTDKRRTTTTAAAAAATSDAHATNRSRVSLFTRTRRGSHAKIDSLVRSKQEKVETGVNMIEID